MEAWKTVLPSAAASRRAPAGPPSPLRQGDPYGKLAALAQHRGHSDRALVQLGEALHQAQAETRAGDARRLLVSGPVDSEVDPNDWTENKPS